MLETLLETMKIVLLVTVAIPMIMGLAMSLLGFGVLEWTRFVDRRTDALGGDTSPSVSRADA